MSKLPVALMSPGAGKALYLLPFDHRSSYLRNMFGFERPLSARQHEQVCDSKRLIYEGFCQAVEGRVANDMAGVLVDEEFGAEILGDAHRRGFVTALSTEQSGPDEFQFEYDGQFAAHIEAFDPSFAKVLVRYNPQGNRVFNARQSARLKQLSDYCLANHRHLMFELLVPATEAQLASVGGDRGAYDQRLRPHLMVEAMLALQDGGIEASVWKVEGLDRREDCERIVSTARRNGREAVGCIVLGRGADEDAVRRWLCAAASVPGFIGFAVGRTTFWQPVAGYVDGMLSRAAAVAQIAHRLRQWIDLFEDEQRSPGTGAVCAELFAGDHR